MFTTESRSDRARAGRWAVTRCAGARTPLPDTSTVTTGETGVVQCFTLHVLLTQTFSTLGQVRSGQSVSRAHSAVVAHACHGHRYRPSPVPLSGAGGYNGVRAVRLESVAGGGWFEGLWNLECPVGLSQKKNMCTFQ